MSLLVISRAEVQRAIEPGVALDLVNGAMRAVSRGEATHLLRRILPLPRGRGILGDMPGSLGEHRTFGLKSISIFPPLPSGRAPHLGFLILFEPEHGVPVAVLEAGSVTAIRTAAATALATRCLARRSALTLAILGAGEQAEHHIPALLSAWPFERLLIWARRAGEAQVLVDLTKTRFPAIQIASVTDPRDTAQADVICTVTSAAEPILKGAWIRPGTHINLVGSSTSGPREADSALLARSRYFVDCLESAEIHASEYLFAIREGVVDATYILGEIGEVLSGDIEGRRADSEITVYKSLGHIAQDLALGWYLYERALAEGFGSRVPF